MPKCDMDRNCEEPVTHLDAKGYVYCEYHGAIRQMGQRCRKMRPHELNRLARGEQIERY